MNDQVTSDIVVTSSPGLDAGAAARFVRTASRFDADVTVHYRGAAANGKSILGLLSLCVRQGDTIRVTASGVGAMRAVEALEALFSPLSDEIMAVPLHC